MSDEGCAGENLFHLEQGIALIRRLGEEIYTAAGPGSFRGGVGGQIRHCYDFYTCLLRGHAAGEIDYSGRDRDGRIEIDPDYAIEKGQGLIGALRLLGNDVPSREVRVRSDGASWSRSTVGRELQFLLSHTIHHHALIVALLAARGVDVARELPEFGVAPSTLDHWKETGPLVS
jgi:hypothetical protein